MLNVYAYIAEMKEQKIWSEHLSLYGHSMPFFEAI